MGLFGIDNSIEIKCSCGWSIKGNFKTKDGEQYKCPQCGKRVL